MLRLIDSLLKGNYKRGEYIAFYFGTHLLRIEATQVLDVPDVQDALTVGPLEAVGHWPDDFHYDEGAFPGCRELVHPLGVLDAP